MKFALSALLMFSFYISTGFSQQSPLQYGEITKEEFQAPLYPSEIGAEAIVILDYADAHIIFAGSTNENESGFKVESNHHVRIKILKSSGYDYANIAITHSKNDKISGLKAIVYNMEGDEIAGTELGKKDFVIEKVNDYYYDRRFTFPEVREGSVIEYTYKLITSDVYEFIPFTMQRDIPVRHAEFMASYPEYFIYDIKRTGNDLMKETNISQKGYFDNVTTSFNVYRWTGNNLPAFQPEPYLPALHEYMAGIRFELAGVDFPGGSDTYASPTYSRYTERLLQRESFGRSLDNITQFDGKISDLIHNITDPLEKMNSIYSFIRNEFRWNGDYSLLLSKSFKEVFTEKNGNSADINLLLVNLLNTAGVNAYPVILSTREHGTLNKNMAFDANFNYVICYTEIQGREYLLDATNNNLPVGYLPDYCLNGEGWLVSLNTGRFVRLHTGENNYYSGIYNLGIQTDGSCAGSVNFQFNGYEGFELKSDLKNLGLKDFSSDVLKDYGKVQFDSFAVEGTDNLDSPLTITLNMKHSNLVRSSGDIYFFSISDLNLLEFKNSFIKELREFPVNIACPEYRNFVYTISIPEDFSILEVPRPQKLTLPDDNVQFTYSVSVEQNTITIISNYILQKTYYDTIEYTALREFYTQMYRKLNEMIILEKKGSLSQL